MPVSETPATPMLRGQKDEFFRGLKGEVRQNLRSGRVILAVDGTPGSGQAEFADRLAAAFTEEGTTVLRADASDFHEAGARAVDADELRRVLVGPFRSSAAEGVALAPGETPRIPPADAVLIVDGDYLLTPELRGLWNWSAWLEVHPASAFARLARENGSDPDAAAASNAVVREAAASYRRSNSARVAASALIENTDPENPTRIFGDFC